MALVSSEINFTLSALQQSYAAIAISPENVVEAIIAAIALPNGFQSNGLPTGVTFIAPPHSESYLADIGTLFHPMRWPQLGATAFELP